MYDLSRSAPARGAIANVTNVVRNAVDVKVLTDERRPLRTAKSCGPGAPRSGAKLATMQTHRADDGGKRDGSPGSNCVEVAGCSAGSKAGAGRPRLRRLTALTPSAHQSSGRACARRKPSGLAQLVPAPSPIFPRPGHDIEGVEQPG